MKNFLEKSIIKAIVKVTGKGPHHLHEPSLKGKEIKYLKEKIHLKKMK